MLRLFFQNSRLKLRNPLLPVWSFCRTVKLDGVLLWKTSSPETANPHFYQISPWRQCDPWPLTTGFLPAELKKLKTPCACFFSTSCNVSLSSMYFLAALLAPSACFLKASLEAMSEACWESRVARRRSNLQQTKHQCVITRARKILKSLRAGILPFLIAQNKFK